MNKQNGITLISLIITIIIMLILAGVSLSMVMGDGSMLDQANAAADKTKSAEVQEYVDLAIAGNKAAKYSKIGYQSKEAVAEAMVAEGFITAEQKTAMLNNEEVKVAGQVIDYSGLNEAVTTYTISYYDGATLLETETVVSGGNGTFTAPTKSGYTFNGWMTTNGGSTAAVLTNITENKTVYAKYTANAVCFVAGTKVLTEKGLVNIEDVKAGMKVYSYNENTKEKELKNVLVTTINHVDSNMAIVTVNGEVIESTETHDFYTVNKGWIDAKDLDVGDVLLNSDNEEIFVESIEIDEFDGNLTTVYNFEVEDNHNYYVGEENVLVHNPYC